MVVISQLRTAAPIGEKVVLIQVLEQAGRFVVAGERSGVGRRDRRCNRREHEHALVLRPRAVENFSGEVLEDRLFAFAKRLIERRAAMAQVLAQQHERCNPAVTLRVDPRHVVRVEVSLSQYRLGLVERTAELCLVYARDAAARPEPGEFGRRIRSRYDDNRDSVGDFRQPLRKRGALLRERTRLVEVVEHDRAGIRQR